MIAFSCHSPAAKPPLPINYVVAVMKAHRRRRCGGVCRPEKASARSYPVHLASCALCIPEAQPDGCMCIKSNTNLAFPANRQTPSLARISRFSRFKKPFVLGILAVRAPAAITQKYSVEPIICKTKMPLGLKTLPDESSSEYRRRLTPTA